MDDVNGGLGCRPGMGLPPGLGLNEFGETCILELEGGGGSASGDGGPVRGAGDDEIVGEPIEVEGDAPLTDCAVEEELLEEERPTCLPPIPDDDSPQSEENDPPQPGFGFFPGHTSVKEAEKKMIKRCLGLHKKMIQLWVPPSAHRADLPSHVGDDVEQRLKWARYALRGLNRKWEEKGLDLGEVVESRHLDEEIAMLERRMRKREAAEGEFNALKCGAFLAKFDRED